MHSFLLAAVDLECTWLHHHASQNIFPQCHFLSYDKSAHLKLLDMFTLAIPHIIPPSILGMPTIWHPDISHSNLLVAQTGLAKVQGLINWQHSLIALYCMQATFPTIFIYDDGLINILQGQVPPKLPSHVSPLNPNEHLHLKLAMRHKVYEQRIMEKNQRRVIACAMPFSPELALLPYHVIRSWSDSLIPLQKALLEL